jgi:hypothetical protein
MELMGFIQRARALRDRLVSDSNRLDDLAQAVRDEAWFARVPAAIPDALMENEYRRKVHELLRTIDDELHRLAPLAAAGVERLAS